MIERERYLKRKDIKLGACKQFHFFKTDKRDGPNKVLGIGKKSKN